MPLATDPPEPAERSSTDLQRGALIAASLTAGIGLALAVLAIAQPNQVSGMALAWLLALAAICAAVGVGWALLRQRAIVSALREARAGQRTLRSLCDTWTFETDGGHRLMGWCPPHGDARRSAAPYGQVGMQLWDCFAGDPPSAALLRAQLEAGLPVRSLVVSRPEDGAPPSAARRFELHALPVADASGRPARWLGTVRPLDEGEALDHDRRLLAAVLPNLPLPVFELVGDETGPRAVSRANPAAAQWMGVKPTALAGVSLDELLGRLPQDLRAAAAQAIADPPAAAEAGSDALQVRLHRVADPAPGHSLGPTPARHWVLSLLPAARTGAPAPASTTPDSESFSYTVSHDLRAPVRVVEGFTKILKEDYGRQLDRIGNDHLDRVLGAAARMNSMIDALLALAQLSSRPLSRQPVNLSQLASYVVEDLRRQAPERNVVVQVEGGLQAQGDPTLLRVVLENLLGNAWKYSARTRDARIWLERKVEDGRTVFTVRDNGAGFDMRFADRLFGVFQRLHSASDFPGTGIGLATVRRIVARHGGEIWAESAVDRGSSFHFTLPAGPTAGN